MTAMPHSLSKPSVLYPIEDLLPHARPMILLDRVMARLDDGIVTELAIHPGLPFFQQGRGIPAHIALEWMAQTCGAHVGATASDTKQPVRVGFLLGTRDFRSDVDWFTEGQVVQVTARLVFHEGETAVFDCHVSCDDRIVVTAQLTVYQPSDIANMLASQGIRPGQ
jgi:predicted hotdog family 3-hydroxylacyl-ACP dehydratase